MISDCLDGQVDLILTKSISRFARNTVDTVTTIRKLKEKGVAVYFEKKDFYTVKMPINAVNTALSKVVSRVMRKFALVSGRNLLQGAA